MSQANSQSEFSTVDVLRSFLSTLTNIHYVLKNHPQANEELVQIISEQEHLLRKQIEITEQNSLQEASHISRDSNYAYSMSLQWDLLIKSIKKKSSYK